MNTTSIVTQTLKKYQLSDEAIAQVLKAGKSRELIDNEIFLNIGQLWNSMIIVVSGALRFYYYGTQHDEANTKFMFEEECFFPAWGEVQHQPSDFAIASVRRSKIFTLSYNELKNIIAKHGSNIFYINFLRDIFQQKTAVEKMLSVPCPIERYRISLAYFNEKSIAIPLKHIASYIGVTNVSLSRIRGKLRENNEI